MTPFAKLTAKERRAVLAGQYPSLSRPIVPGQPCPYMQGEVLTLRSQRSLAGPVPQVSIRIEGVRRTRKGDWLPQYSVRDDRSLYLARGIGYTRSLAQAVDVQAPVEDEGTLRRFVVEARLHQAEREEAGEAAGAKRDRDQAAALKQASRKLCRLQTEGLRYGIDLAPRILSMVREAQSEIAERRAAA